MQHYLGSPSRFHQHFHIVKADAAGQNRMEFTNSFLGGEARGQGWVWVSLAPAVCQLLAGIKPFQKSRCPQCRLFNSVYFNYIYPYQQYVPLLRAIKKGALELVPLTRAFQYFIP